MRATAARHDTNGYTRTATRVYSKAPACLRQGSGWGWARRTRGATGRTDVTDGIAAAAALAAEQLSAFTAHPRVADIGVDWRRRPPVIVFVLVADWTAVECNGCIAPGHP